MTVRLPLFPLDVVLFPGELLPLHIFEPRCRQLLADCLDGDPRFGITASIPPGPGAIGTVARIRASTARPDGRSDIVVQGESRFGIRTLLDEGTPYLVGAVQEFADRRETDPLPAELGELRRQGTLLRGAITTLADAPGEPAHWSDEAERFTFQIAALAELDLDLRRELLALTSTRDRTRRLLALLPPRLAQLARRAEVHVRARLNGHGHPGADIRTDP